MLSLIFTVVSSRAALVVSHLIAVERKIGNQIFGTMSSSARYRHLQFSGSQAKAQMFHFPFIVDFPISRI